MTDTIKLTTEPTVKRGQTPKFHKLIWKYVALLLLVGNIQQMSLAEEVLPLIWKGTAQWKNMVEQASVSPELAYSHVEPLATELPLEPSPLIIGEHYFFPATYAISKTENFLMCGWLVNMSNGNINTVGDLDCLSNNLYLYDIVKPPLWPWGLPTKIPAETFERLRAEKERTP